TSPGYWRRSGRFDVHAPKELDHSREPLLELYARLVPEHGARLGDVRRGLAQIAGAGGLVLDLQPGGGRSDHLLERGDQVDQRRAHPAGYVDDLARGLVARRRQEVRAHHVRDVDEVARLQAVAENDGPLPLEKPRGEPRDGRRIVALRVLPRAVDVEVAERDAGQAVRARIGLRVQLAGDLLRRVWAHRPGHQAL